MHRLDCCPTKGAKGKMMQCGRDMGVRAAPRTARQPEHGWTTWQRKLPQFGDNELECWPEESGHIEYGLNDARRAFESRRQVPPFKVPSQPKLTKKTVINNLKIVVYDKHYSDNVSRTVLVSSVTTTSLKMYRKFSLIILYIYPSYLLIVQCTRT